MQLQIALDRIDLDTATRITAAVAGYADWIEVGTSLIKRYGMASVTETVRAAGETPVLADLKTADDATTEFGMAFEHGARGVTVLAAASDSTIERSCSAARQAGAELLVDLMATSAARRDLLLRTLPAEVVLAQHIGKDTQRRGDGLDTALGDWVRGRRVAVAGGVTARDMESLSGTPAAQLRVIAGSAVTTASDPVAAVQQLSAATNERSTA